MRCGTRNVEYANLFIYFIFYKGKLNEWTDRAALKGDITVQVPATCVFLAFAFPFQAFPLSTADERRHGGIAVLGFCKQTNNIVLTNPDVCEGQFITTG